ncbi:MAG: tetratricopeptide repeat protein [Desulfomonilaceae bacterium]
MLDVKISFTLSVLTIAPSGGPAPIGKAGKLSIPWQDNLQEVSNVASLLSWRTYLSDFAGLEDQMDELSQWAMSPPLVSLKFMIGEGGTGKTRTAAEFARSLQRQDKWATGFVHLRKPQSYGLSKKGNLLVVDYPEEQQSAVTELLKDLAGLGPDCPRLRVLLVTRRSIQHWYDVIADSKANAVVDMKPVMVHGLSPEDAYRVFCSAQDRAAKHLKTTPVPVSEEQLDAWLRLTPENDRALFVVAAAVHSAVNPDDLVVQYSGSQVVQSIAEREAAGLRNIAKAEGLQNEYVLARILAVTAVAGSMTEAAVLKMAQGSPELLGVQPGEDIRKALRSITVGPEKLIPPPKPDILAAAIVVRVLREMPETAPELIWKGIAPDVPNSLNRVARLSYDAEIVLGMLQHRISDWLADVVQGRKGRCEILGPYFSVTYLPVGCTRAAVATWRTLLNCAVTEEEKAVILNNLSAHLSYAGENEEALQAIREAVKINRHLAKARPTRYKPDLAISLNNLSNRLGDAGDHQGALQIARESMQIRRRLAGTNPARFEPDLASSLNNLSSCLANTGDHEGSLRAIREAVEIRRRLAETQPALYGPDLAMSLNNLSGRLSASGDNSGALEAISKSLAVCRRLAEIQPARYEPVLATSLNNLSLVMSAAGRREEALHAISEAVEIRRRLAKSQQPRYEPYLADSLNNLSLCLSASGEKDEALLASGEAVEIHRRITEAQQALYEPELARSIRNLGLILKKLGQHDKANSALAEAAELVRPYAQRWPKSRHMKLLRDIESMLKS